MGKQGGAVKRREAGIPEGYAFDEGDIIFGKIILLHLDGLICASEQGNRPRALRVPLWRAGKGPVLRKKWAQGPGRGKALRGRRCA